MAKTLTVLAALAVAGVLFCISSADWAGPAQDFGSLFSSGGHSRPPPVPGAGAEVLQPIDDALGRCVGGSGSGTSAAKGSDQEISTLAGRSNSSEGQRAQHRRDFACAAGCSAREPQLEHSLGPWADWDTNTSGLDTLRLLWGFCTAPRQCRDPFVIFVLWRGEVHVRHCGGRYGLKDPALYLIGPEDLSLAIIFLLASMRLAGLPPGPISFGMYLSDYTCLLDHHLYGPGVPIFAYLARETSWVIPFPSSFSVISTKEIDEWQAELRKKSEGKPHEDPLATRPWDDRTSRAYWVGAITGPWEFAADPALMAVPRLKLLRLAKDHPDRLKAEWSNLATYGISWVHDSQHVSGFMNQGQPHGLVNLTGIDQNQGFTPLKRWSHYKYYLNIDGVVMGGRMNKLMSLGGVVLQHQAGYYEHFEDLLEPYEHYVPIAYDLSDLVSTVQWLQDNDAEARRIAENGQRLADERLRIEDHLCYVWRALEGLGTKTSSVEADPNEVQAALAELEFISAPAVDNSMRQTLEKFWSKVLEKPVALEKVTLGRRKMNKKGIDVLQWTWDKYSSLYEKAHGKR